MFYLFLIEILLEEIYVLIHFIQTFKCQNIFKNVLKGARQYTFTLKYILNKKQNVFFIY